MNGTERQDQNIPNRSAGSGTSAAQSAAQAADEAQGQDGAGVGAEGTDVHGDQVGGDKITTGDINAKAVAIGRGAVANFIEIVKHPAQWQDTIFNFLSKHRYFLAVVAVVLIALLVLYWLYKDLYLISWTWYAAAAVLLLAASWAFYSSYPSRRIGVRKSVGLLSAAGFLAIFGWHASRVAFPPTFERQVFGIALAEAAEGGNLRRTASAKELSDEVYERLCADLQRRYGREQDVNPCAADLPQPDERRVAVQRIGIVADSARAEKFGRRINADVVIWGRMLAREQGGITLRFEVLETLDKAINPDFRVIMPVTTTSTELLGIEQDIAGGTVEAKEVAAQQAIALSSYILGLIAYLDRDFPEAAKQIEITIDTIEDSSLLRVPEEGRALIYFYLARAYHALSRVAEGQELLLRAEKANPEEPAFNISLALGYGAIGPPEKLEENLSLAMDKLNAWLLENPQDSNALFDRALVHEITHQYQNAAFDYETLLRNDPDFYTAYIQLGLVTFELGRFEEAVDWFEQAIALAEESGANPTSAYVRLGEIYEKAGQVEQAREMYQKAAARDPDSDKVFHYYAQFLESQQEMDAALAAYQQMAEASYLPGWAYGELAAFYRRRGLLEEAIVSFQRATGADNDNVLLYTYLAETYDQNGQTDEAADAYEDALERDEEEGIYYIYDSYAGFLFKTGEPAEAAEMYRRSLELRPVNYPALMNLGQTYQALGERAQAVATYCQILEYDDEFSPEQLRGAEERLANLGPDASCL